MSHKLALITVVYQNYDVIKEFINSLQKQNNHEYRLFLIDQSDHKKDVLTNGVPTTVVSSVNQGYAHGINLGLGQALKNDFTRFCVINSDTYFKEDFVNTCLSSINEYQYSILGGKIYYAPGFEYHKKYQKTDLGKVIWYCGGKIDWQNVYIKHRGVDEIDSGQYDNFTETDFVTGCLMCFDKKVIDKVGFWDDSYFLYFEDADYCERAKKKGIYLYYDPALIIWHKNAQSTGGSGSSIHQKYQRFNQLKFGLKYAPLKTKIHLLKNYFFDKK